MTNTCLLSKTHYEIAISFFEKRLGVDIAEVSRLFQLYSTNHDFKTFQLFIQNEIPLLKKLGEGDFVYYTNVLFHFCLMKIHNERIYSVAPIFSTKLVNTNLNVDTHFLKTPFEEIFIQVDPHLFSIIDFQTMEKVGVNGFYVYMKDKGDTKEIRIMAASLLPSTEQFPFNDSVFYYKLELPQQGLIKENVRAYLKQQVIWNQYELEKFRGNLNVNIIEEITYFIFNTLLYITSKEPDIIKQLPSNFAFQATQKKNKAKIRKALQKSEKYSTLPIIMIGSRVIDNLKEVEKIKEEGGIFKWKLTKRLYVEGYWRVQWYGSEKNNTKESKIIFIAPHYKGPEFSEVLHRSYQIGKS